MIKDNKKDHLLRSFLDSLYIEKGLSKNTVSSYKNDISSFSSWCDKEHLDRLKISGNHFGQPTIPFLQNFPPQNPSITSWICFHILPGQDFM